MFVGMTRAMKQLYLTTAQMRAERGTPRITIPSTFLSETEFVHGEVEPEQSQGGRGDGFTKKEQDIRERLKAALKNSDGPMITTGAALLAGTGEEAKLPQSDSSFSVGMRVRHPRYGNGTVTEVSGVSKKQTVTVEFQNDSRSETFRAAFCPLQPVGGR